MRQLLSVGNERTIWSALQGGDAKLGICYYKTLYDDGDRKTMQSIKITSRPLLKIRNEPVGWASSGDYS